MRANNFRRWDQAEFEWHQRSMEGSKYVCLWSVIPGICSSACRHGTTTWLKATSLVHSRYTPGYCDTSGLHLRATKAAVCYSHRMDGCPLSAWPYAHRRADSRVCCGNHNMASHRGSRTSPQALAPRSQGSKGLNAFPRLECHWIASDSSHAHSWDREKKTFCTAAWTYAHTLDAVSMFLYMEMLPCHHAFLQCGCGIPSKSSDVLLRPFYALHTQSNFQVCPSKKTSDMHVTQPGNVLLSQSGVVKITDLGQSKQLAATLGLMGTYVGAQVYMSPQRIQVGTSGGKTACACVRACVRACVCVRVHAHHLHVCKRIIHANTLHQSS
jgi:hypothetical protein